MWVAFHNGISSFSWQSFFSTSLSLLQRQLVNPPCHCLHLHCSIKTLPMVQLMLLHEDHSLHRRHHCHQDSCRYSYPRVAGACEAVFFHRRIQRPFSTTKSKTDSSYLQSSQSTQMAECRKFATYHESKMHAKKKCVFRQCNTSWAVAWTRVNRKNFAGACTHFG